MNLSRINFLLVVLLLSITLPCQAAAQDDWSKADTARQVTYLTLHVMDWGQSRYIAQHPERREANPILGAHPAVKTVDNYFLATAALHATVAYVLPHIGRLLPEEYQRALYVSEWRAVFQYITIGMEAGVVQRNYRVGVKIAF